MVANETIVIHQEAFTFEIHHFLHFWDVALVRNGSCVSLYLNVSLDANGTAINLTETSVRAEVYRNQELLENKAANLTHHENYSEVVVSHEASPSFTGTLILKLMIEHDTEHWKYCLLERRELFFSVLSPLPNQVFNATPPNLTIWAPILDLDEIWYSMDDGVHDFTLFYQNGTLPAEKWNSLDNGLINLTIWVNDSFGNAARKTVLFEKDVEIPLLILSSHDGDLVFNGTSPTFVLHVSEPHLESIQYELRDPSNDTLLTGTLLPSPPSFEFSLPQDTWEGVEEGTCMVILRANDSVGNSVREVFLVEKDITPPAFVLIDPQNNSVFNEAPPEFELFLLDDTNITVGYTIEAGEYQGTIIAAGSSGTVEITTWSALPDGKIKLTFWTRDRGSNENRSIIHVYKDTMIPLLSILEPQPQEKFGKNPPHFKIRVIESNILTMYYVINDEYRDDFYSNTSISYSYWRRQDEGTVLLDFYVVDMGGKQNHRSVYVIKDLAISEDDGGEKGKDPSEFDLSGEYPETNSPEKDWNYFKERLKIWGIWYGAITLVFLVYSAIIRNSSLLKSIGKFLNVWVLSLMVLSCAAFFLAPLKKSFSTIYATTWYSLPVLTAVCILLIILGRRKWELADLNQHIGHAMKQLFGMEGVTVPPPLKPLIHEDKIEQESEA